jgi:hypothetical protein
MFSGHVKTIIDRYPMAAGLPDNGKFIAISNSDVGKLACERRFLLSQIEALKAPSTGPMDLGTAWHEVSEDCFRWWALQDTGYPDEGLDRCPFCRGSGVVDEATGIWQGKELSCARCLRCNGSGKSALSMAMVPYRAKVETMEISSGDADLVEETLRRMLQGYLKRWESGPLDSIKILGVEMSLSRAIVNPKTGLVFKPEVTLEQNEDGFWVLTGPGSTAKADRGEGSVRRVRWPWYQVGYLDVLGCDRVTKLGWVIDIKGSGQPSRYPKGMGVDPQLPGYCWLLEGHLQDLGCSGIAGFMYDVSNTKYQPDPHELKWIPPKMDDLKAMVEAKGIKVTGRKSEDYCQALGIVPGHGGFSVAMNSGVPSWRYEWAIKAAGVDRAPYEEHLQYLAETVDPGLYSRPWMRYGESHRQRYGREIYAKAVRMHLLRKAAAGCDDAEGLDVLFPRTPVCTVPGSGCGYSDLCAAEDCPRTGYYVTPTQRWAEESDRQSADGEQQQQTELGW